jgi:fluoride exporter
MTLPLWIMAALGGAIGASARYGASEALRAAGYVSWPWATFAVNAVGGLLMGMLVGVLAKGNNEALRVFAGVGILGGFTTFSAFSLETTRMIEAGDLLGAMVYAVVSVVVCVMAVMFGDWLARGFS